MNYIRHLNAFFSRVKADSHLSCNHISLYMALFQYWNYNRFEGPFPIYRANIMQLSKIGSKNTYHKCIKELHQAGYIRFHPAINKHAIVKVSIRRLDQLEDATDRPQLDLFNAENMNASCPKTGTHGVPLLTVSSPKTETPGVPKPGHIIKPINYIQTNSVLNTHTENPKKNVEGKREQGGSPYRGGSPSSEGEKQTPAAAPNPVPPAGPSQHGPYQVGQEGGRMLVPTFSEIELFFQRNGYPVAEAQKFWLYNRSRGWMLSDNMPIWNWQPLAHKWMLNTRQDGSKVSGTSHLDTQTDKNYDEPL